jgi:hypothetical protein
LVGDDGFPRVIQQKRGSKLRNTCTRWARARWARALVMHFVPVLPHGSSRERLTMEMLVTLQKRDGNPNNPSFINQNAAMGTIRNEGLTMGQTDWGT